MGKNDTNSVVSLIGSGFQKGLKLTGNLFMYAILIAFSMLAMIASPLLMWMHKIETSK